MQQMHLNVFFFKLNRSCFCTGSSTTLATCVTTSRKFRAWLLSVVRVTGATIATNVSVQTEAGKKLNNSLCM